MKAKQVTEADVRKMLTEEENAFLDAAFEAERMRGEPQTRGPRDCASSWLDGAIIFITTPQGHDYWQAICDRLRAEEKAGGAE